ncbi:MAG: DUF1566 domain-containing protein [Deltaproteobacteria bacterium]|nr:DUF1566 domain-containing protein [Deltaproteobacteria bacterium]
MKYDVFLLTVLVCLSFALAFSAACEPGDDDDDDDDAAGDGTYTVVDTNQTTCYGEVEPLGCPASGSDYHGQDAQYAGSQPSYADNGDGTVTDERTGLMWQQDPGDKQSYDEAVAGAEGFDLAGYTDWRLPTVKELYSLILFSGEDPSSEDDTAETLTPFIDADIFGFEYGDPDVERVIDSQWATRSIYTSTVFGGDECFFGVNFADGRIKCYPTSVGKAYFVLYVRDQTSYGKNDFTDNGDGTVNDAATGLMWQHDDNGTGVEWDQALAYCEDFDGAGYDDWRLPNAKELESLVDYSRSPDATGTAAIDPVFETSAIVNEAGLDDFPYFWTSTTHVKSTGAADSAAYVSFGRALGLMNGTWMDVHGAGAQRSDPKSGDPNDYPVGHGPQGDAIRIFNYVRCVRDGGTGFDNTDGDDGNAGDDDAGPPQEAVDACDGNSESDECAFEGAGGETVTGTCEFIGEELACVPEGGPPTD